jgi:hypothetical protein
MTKDEELAVLDAAISKLGPNSYIGPWLQSVRGEVEQSIRSDITPPVSWRAHYQQQERDQKLFQERCAELEQRRLANQEAETQKFRRKCRDVMDSAAAATRAALRQLESY